LILYEEGTKSYGVSYERLTLALHYRVIDERNFLVSQEVSGNKNRRAGRAQRRRLRSVPHTPESVDTVIDPTLLNTEPLNTYMELSLP